MAHLRTVVTLAALLATLPSAAPVADVAILGPPNNSCGSWLSYRRAQGGPMLWQIEQWVAGFLSGMAVKQSGSDFLNGLDAEAVFGWLDNYCSAHPLERISNALLDLASERGMPLR